MKIFNLVLALIFFSFAALQLNDTPGDVLFWVLIYCTVGLVSAFGAFDKYNMWIIILGIGAALYRLFRDLPEFLMWITSGTPNIVEEMKAATPYIETAREFFGLILCIIALVYHYVRYTRMKNRKLAAESQQEN
ncbi:MAG TPA: transmembrane 220 family protein [Saprospiraceae bacterium]|nr:transmembrane 220 family protein [Saprospiraceae bacterium]